ncbi:hypothetical protein TGAM01_v206136 [Trichoderma gamsii]|uniref:Secreted protein n=1 Tax=Trichoderma gamsii TaxID=398673 RepID=A0A2P4ZLE2_9HYPO|nr:hypothetical protein TGAM01_v206136 [Trichoderma gamsii]PON25055.1 hypothetical protein TGAM01_v206136 [Trichoderma gamsii]
MALVIAPAVVIVAAMAKTAVAHLCPTTAFSGPGMGTLTALQPSLWNESSVWTNAHKPSTDHRPVLSSDTGPVQASSLPWPATCNGARAAGIGFPFSPLGVPALECKELPCEREEKDAGR